MYIPYKIIPSLELGEVKNYLRSMGWLVIQDFYVDEEVESLNETWNDCFDDIASQSKTSVPNYRQASCYCDRVFPSYFSTKFMALVKNLIGKDAVYLGSSATAMKVPTPWHRDVYTSFPIYKVASYISNRVGGLGITHGNLCVIPGSQSPNDLYSQCINQVLGWPQSSGLKRDNNFFPKVTLGDVASTVDMYPNYNNTLGYLPYVEIKVAANDLVLFDQRVVHGSTFYSDGMSRRMLQASFAINPLSKLFREDVEGRFYASQEQMKAELINLIEIESSQLGWELYKYVRSSPTLSDILAENLFDGLDCDKDFSHLVVSNREILDQNHSFFRRNSVEFSGSLL